MTEGALGLFASPEALLQAVRSLRGWPMEACTPHPVPGLAEALGLAQPRPGRAVLVAALVAAGAGFALQYWAGAVDYPLMTGGKPPGAWVPFLPVLFELAILAGALTAALGVLGLPRFGHPVLACRGIAGITRDRYGLILAGPAPACAAALTAAGAETVEAVAEPVWPRPVRPTWILPACAGTALAVWGLASVLPELPPWSRIQVQPKLAPQAPSRFFRDGRGMRLPVPGTVARGHMPLAVASRAEAERLLNPLPRTPAVLQAGRAAFSERCALCHGPLGDGRGSMTAAYGAAPANLLADAVRGFPDGRIYWVIVKGQNAMPGHEAELDGDRRWALVHYLRALQRAGQARTADLPEATP